MKKLSIRFFNNKEVRAIWDDDNSRWFFSVIDIIAVLTNQDDYHKNRNYWKWLKNKLKKENNELVSATNQFKLIAPDGKYHLADTLDDQGILRLVKEFPSKKVQAFTNWFIYSGETIDSKSKQKAYSLFESSFIDNVETGTIKGLQQIHSYLFGGLYNFAGQIRTKNISKGDFTFASVTFLLDSLKKVELMPESTYEEIIEKYVELNIAHPFMEGNGRSGRIWLDLLLKSKLKKCVDWSKIKKHDYLAAMKESVIDSNNIATLIKNALTKEINNRDVFMKGIDYSYYYEEES